jgi:hypothetical protein
MEPIQLTDEQMLEELKTLAERKRWRRRKWPIGNVTIDSGDAGGDQPTYSPQWQRVWSQLSPEDQQTLSRP